MKKATQTISAIAVLVLVACVIMFIRTMAYSGSTTQTSDDEAHGSSHPADVIVYDRSQHVMPVYCQTDPDWAGTPYLSGTIGSHGCGLVCASMAYSYILGEELEPDELLEMVGDTCSTDGVNDMMKFARWLSDNYYGGIRYERVWLLDTLKHSVNTEDVVFVGMSGILGDRMYSSHVVLMTDMTATGASIIDPYEPDNTRTFTWDELERSGFIYYVILHVT